MKIFVIIDRYDRWYKRLGSAVINGYLQKGSWVLKISQKYMSTHNLFTMLHEKSNFRSKTLWILNFITNVTRWQSTSTPLQIGAKCYLSPVASLQYAIHVARCITQIGISTATYSHCQQRDVVLSGSLEQQQQGPGIIAAAITIQNDETILCRHQRQGFMNLSQPI